MLTRWLNSAAMSALMSMLALPALAAEPRNGFYLAAGIGGAIPSDVDGTVGATPVSFQFEPGLFASAALGYAFGPGIRLEGEFSYNRASFDKLRVGAVTASLNGEIDIYSFTAGAYYDWRFAPGWALSVGGGLGAAYQVASTTTATLAGVTATTPGADATDFTAYADIGLSWALSDRVEIAPSYRFQYIDNGGGGFDSLNNHIIKMGLRYRF